MYNVLLYSLRIGVFFFCCFFFFLGGGGAGGGVGGTPYNGLHGEAPPERGTFFRLQVYKRVRISQAEEYKRVRKSVI